MKVITSPRDTPGDSVVWRGAAIMAGLETAQVERFKSVLPKIKLFVF